MNCLSHRKKFKNKNPVWSDPDEVKGADGTIYITEEDLQSDHDEASGSSSSDDDDLDMYANDVRSKKINLETKNLQFKHLVNLNNERSYKGAVGQVQFHPKSKIGLVGLKTGQIDLYEVDGEKNRYLQNIDIPYARNPCCSFMPDGNSIVISSVYLKGTFYSYDMVSASVKQYKLQVGRDFKELTDFKISGDHMACRKENSPVINVLSSKTFENTFSVKLNEPARAIQFTDNNEMFVVGDNARVYLWDLRKTSLCKHKFQDDGSVHATSLAISDASNSLSIGSDSGIVNSYELDKCKKERFPIPIKTYKNLKKPVDILRYNSTGELLLIGSSAEQKAFRMVHSHSGLVYKNFPVERKQYGTLLDADFSALGGYLALGCTTGRAQLIRIPYYKSY